MLDPETLKYMKKELHRRVSRKTIYPFQEIVHIINEFFEEVEKGIKERPDDDPMKKAMEASNETFEELKKEAGIDKPPEPVKKSKA